MQIDTLEYKNALQRTLECIKTAQYEAVINTNLALLHRNWKIGSIIIQKSEWGNKFISNLAADIKREFPETTGFSARNLQYKGASIDWNKISSHSYLRGIESIVGMEYLEFHKPITFSIGLTMTSRERVIPKWKC